MIRPQQMHAKVITYVRVNQVKSVDISDTAQKVIQRKTFHVCWWAVNRTKNVLWVACDSAKDSERRMRRRG